MRGGSRRRVWRRVGLGAIALVTVLVLVAGIVLVIANGRIARVDVAGLSGGGPMHVLVVGSDSREGLTEQEQVELTAGFVAGERTDTMFLMTIDGGRVALLAFPRDLWVTRCDGTKGRINGAFAIGGRDCLVETVATTSGIPVRHYVEVDFGGFRDIVDAVGGVDLCLESAILDPFAGVDLPAGCQRLDGRQALGYVRTRKIDNDLERIKRQQQFLRALASAVVSPGNLVNPFRVLELSGAIGGALTVDDGLGPFGLLRLGNGIRGLARGASATHTVPVTSANIGGASVLLPVDAEAQALFARFRDLSVLDDAVAGLRPADVEVRVLNGAGVAGLAAATRDLVAGLGFVVTGIGDAAAVDATVVRHPPGQAEAAALLADRLPISPPLVEDASVTQVTLVAGADLRP